MFTATPFIMGKYRDGKFPILPSTTRRGTVLNTSAALDSPSVISKLVTPPPHTHATHTATTAESETDFDAHDVTSTMLDASGPLGPFLDATMCNIPRIISLDNQTQIKI